VGKLLLDGGLWTTKSYIFSSDFPLYLLGGSDKLFPGGGRILSALLGFGSLFFVFLIQRNFDFSLYTSLLGTLFIAIQPSNIIVGKMATYDSLCLFFICGTAFFLHSAVRNNRDGGVVLASLFMCGAILSKYIGVAYFPLFGFLLFQKDKFLGGFFVSLVSTVVAFYMANNWSELMLLYHKQILEVHTKSSTLYDVLLVVVQHSWPLVLLMSIFFVYNIKKINWNTVFSMLFLASPMLVYHIISQNFISLYKHMVYPSLFMAALIVYLIVENKSRSIVKTSFLWAGSILICLMNSYLIMNDFKMAWPNTGGVMENIEYDENISILSEDPYLFRNKFYGVVGTDKFYDTNWFDPNNNGWHDRNGLTKAVQEGWFDYIYINKLITPNYSSFLIKNKILERYKIIYYEAPSMSKLTNKIKDPVNILYKKI
jgi:hypothetical protein